MTLILRCSVVVVVVEKKKIASTSAPTSTVDVVTASS